MLLEGKTIVVTGALRGIGRDTVELCAQLGANVWAGAQYPDEAFETWCATIARQDRWVRPLYFDLASTDAIKSAIRVIQADRTPVHALVNIAGYTQDALFQMTSLDQLRQVFEVNVFSQIVLSQLIAKFMLKQRHGSIIHVSSVSALDGNVGQLAYSSSKAALIGVTRTMSRELGPQGIRVNAIAPGVIDTAMNRAVPADLLAARVAGTSLARIGRGSEVAGVAAFLASDLSPYVTGQVIRIDGGMK